MNKIYRVIWNEITCTFVAVAEIAKGRGKGHSISPGGVATYRNFVFRPLVLAMAMFGLGAQASPPAPGQLPTGGQVVAGQATISQNNAQMNVQQSSANAVVNWQTFNVGSQAQINFQQPSSSAAILNRVQDPNPSQIFGRISANGQVFITNSSGVYFSPTANVNVGALTVTTHGISNEDFMAGNYRFTRDGATGKIINEGQLTAELGGYIALLAPEVRNQGVIVAQMGTVALASGEAIQLQLDGNRLLDILVEPSKIAALIENKSAIEAPGGLIILSAKAADSLLGGVVRNTGRIEATGLSMKGGKIVLSASSKVDNAGLVSTNAGLDGSPAGEILVSAPHLVNSGSITANALTPEGRGGRIQIDAETIENSGIISAVGGQSASAEGGLLQLSAKVIDQTASGKLDVGSGKQAGVMELTATESLSLAGELNARSENGDGGRILLNSNGDITLSSARLDTSGANAGGHVVVDAGQGRQSPLPDAPEHKPTLALIGTTQIRASGRHAQGGYVSLTGERVGLFDASLVDASGATGGGTVLIGGDYQGNNPDVRNAQATYVAADVAIRADATEQGDGGKVIVWADDFTRYQGHISAQGGAAGGDGGFAEVSGKRTLAFEGTVDLKAAQGKNGTLLLDPTNLTITTTSNNINGATPFTPTGAASTLNVSTLALALDSADVVVTTMGSLDTGAEAGDITVASSIGWFTANKLTLQAAGAITINDSVNIQTFDGSLVLDAVTGITQNTSTAGRLLIGGTTELSTTSGNISLNSTTNLLSGAVTAMATNGDISIKNARALVLGNVSASGSVTLETTDNAGSITSSGTFAAGSLYAKAQDTGGISIADVNGSLTVSLLEAGGAITLGNADTGSLTFAHASDGSNVIVGNDAAGGQASGIVTIIGHTITLNDPIRTKGGNVNLESKTGAVTTASDAHIVTTADPDTGTASGLVTVTAANGISLQNITTTGAQNAIGVGSNAAAVTLTATTGDINVGAINTNGGLAATNVSYPNRNGGNAGSIIINAPGGTMYLNGDLNAIGGSPYGAATQGLGGYINLKTPVILTADRVISSGATSGYIDIDSTVDSDIASRSLTVTAGTGNVTFNGVIGGTAALKSLAVSSSYRTDIEKNVTTK